MTARRNMDAANIDSESHPLKPNKRRRWWVVFAKLFETFSEEGEDFLVIDLKVVGLDDRGVDGLGEDLLTEALFQRGMILRDVATLACPCLHDAFAFKFPAAAAYLICSTICSYTGLPDL